MNSGVELWSRPDDMFDIAHWFNTSEHPCVTSRQVDMNNGHPERTINDAILRSAPHIIEINSLSSLPICVSGPEVFTASDFAARPLYRWSKTEIEALNEEEAARVCPLSSLPFSQY